MDLFQNNYVEWKMPEKKKKEEYGMIPFAFNSR